MIWLDNPISFFRAQLIVPRPARGCVIAQKKSRHSRAGGNPGRKDTFKYRLPTWIPAYAGVSALIFAISFSLFPSYSHSASSEIRKSPLAGSWYLKDSAKLENRLSLYLKRAGDVQLAGKPIALISPHAGFRYSGQAAAYGFKSLKGQNIKRVIILGLSHQFPYEGASIPNVSHYETPLGIVPLDQNACQKLKESSLFKTIPRVHQREHSIEMQIPFLQMVLGKNVKIVPIAFGSLKKSNYLKAAAEIRKIMDDTTLLLVSSDFLHFGERFSYFPFVTQIPTNIQKTDFGAINYILKKDFDGYLDYREKTQATICGRVPIGVLLHLLPPDSQGDLLRYYRSGDMTGDWKNSVSYASILFTKGKTGKNIFKGSEKEVREKEMLAPKEQEKLLVLARKTVESFVKKNKVPNAKKLEAEMDPDLKKVLGVFVTLKKHGQLRGCIGHIVGREPLFEGTISNAVNSCAYDHRFSPVKPHELKDIHIEVSVLSPLKKTNDYKQIIPGWHGVVLQKGQNQSVYLPQVAIEANWEVEEMLSHLSQKAGLSPQAWRQNTQFHTFEAQIFSE